MLANRPRHWMAHAAAVVAAVAAPAIAGACSVCSFAAAERTLPPVVPWTFTGIGLYAIVVYGLRPDHRWFSFFFDPWSGALILGFGVFATFTAGPVGGMPLLALGVLGLAVSLLAPDQGCARWLPRAVAVGLIGWLAGSGVSTTVANARRDDVDYAVRWSSTPAAHEIVIAIERQRDVASLRRLLAAEGSFHSSQAAMALAELGDPAIDAPLILAAMERAAASPDDSWLVSSYTTALEAMLSGKPRHGDGVEAWRAFLATKPWEKKATAS